MGKPPSMTSRPGGLALAAGLLLTLALRAAGGTVVLYETGFEAPEFTVGQLPGQNGWVAYGGYDESALQVVGDDAASGRQAAMIDLGSPIRGARDQPFRVPRIPRTTGPGAGD